MYFVLLLFIYLYISFLQGIGELEDEFQEYTLSCTPYFLPAATNDYLFDDVECEMSFFNMSLSKDSRPFLNISPLQKVFYAINTFDQIFVSLLQFESLNTQFSPLIPFQTVVTKCKVQKYYELPEFNLTLLGKVPNGPDLETTLKVFFGQLISQRQTGLPLFELLCVSFLY